MQTIPMLIMAIITLSSTALCCFLLKKVPEDLIKDIKEDQQELDQYQLPPVTNTLYYISIICCIVLLPLFFYLGSTSTVKLALITIFLWMNILLTMIDIRAKLLPDKIVYPFLWLGLISNTANIFCSPTQAILGATALYLLFWFINKISCYITKSPVCMGNGDMKMMSAIGAWFGINEVSNIMYIILFITIIVGIIFLCLQKLKLYNDKYFPYGIVISTSSIIYYILYQIK